MNISKITLVDGGLKGIKVEYTEPNEKDGRSKFDKIKKEIKHPIHLGLEKPFKDLRFHLLEICGLIEPGGMTKHEINVHINGTEIEFIEISTDSFFIKGHKELYEGKFSPIETPSPNIDAEDGYVNFDGVVALIKTIIEETKLYMAGEVKVTDEEAFERWMQLKAKPTDKSAFEEMSPEEQMNYMSEILQTKFGAAVMLPGDFTVSNGDNEEEVNSEEISEVNDQENHEPIVIDMNSPEAIKIPISATGK